MTNLTMTRYPVKETYKGKGLTESEIDSDLVMTIMRRFYQMTESERDTYGLTEDMITSNNLYRMIQEGRIRMIGITIERWPSFMCEVL